jgi:hypothetical protein
VQLQQGGLATGRPRVNALGDQLLADQGAEFDGGLALALGLDDLLAQVEPDARRGGGNGDVKKGYQESSRVRRSGMARAAGPAG